MRRSFLTLIFITMVLNTSPFIAVAQDDNQLSYTKQLVLGRGLIGYIAWSPDGSQLAVSTPVDIWIYSNTLQDVIHLDHIINIPSSIVWSSDGSLLAGIGSDIGFYSGYEVVVWDTATGAVSFDAKDEFAASQGVVSLAWRPNSTQLALGTGSGLMRVWDVVAGEEVAQLHTTPISSIHWNSDGSELMTAHIFDSAIRVWDVSTDSVRRAISYPPHTTQDVVWNPNGRTFASKSGSPIYVGDIETGTILATLEVPYAIEYHHPVEPTVSLDWNPVGEGFAIAWYREREPGFLQVWNPETGEVLPSFASIEGKPILQFKWSPDGSMFAVICSDGSIELRDAVSGEILYSNYQHPRELRDLAWSPDGSKIATLGGIGQIWDVSSQQVLTVFPDQNVNSVSWLSDNQLILYSEVKPTRYEIEACQWTTWDTTANQFGELLWAGEGSQCPAALSPDLAYIAAYASRETDEDTYTVVIEELDGTQVASLEIDMHQTMVWSDDSRILFISSSEGTTIWNAETGTFNVVGEPYPEKLIPSPDEHWILTSNFITANVWNTATGSNAFSFSTHLEFDAGIIADWHTDNRFLAALTGAGIEIREVESGDIITILPTLDAIALAWSPDGTQLAAAIDSYRLERTGTLEIWTRD